MLGSGSHSAGETTFFEKERISKLNYLVLWIMGKKIKPTLSDWLPGLFGERTPLRHMPSLWKYQCSEQKDSDYGFPHLCQRWAHLNEVLDEEKMHRCVEVNNRGWHSTKLNCFHFTSDAQCLPGFHILWKNHISDRMPACVYVGVPHLAWAILKRNIIELPMFETVSFLAMCLVP